MISRAARNPWLLVFIGIPLLAVAWALAHWALPRGQNYYGLFAAAVVAGVIGNVLLVAALCWGNGVVRLAGGLFLLANWPVAADWLKVEPWRPRVTKYRILPPVISTITAQPEFEPRNGYDLILLSDSSRSFRIYGNLPPPGLLDPEKSYVFTVEETSMPLLPPSRGSFKDGEITVLTGHRERPEMPAHGWFAEIMTIDHDGIRIYDRSVCEVHQQKMERREVVIRYGLLSQAGLPGVKEETELFPHYRDFEAGGCVIMPESPENEKRFVCGSCEAAFKKWQAEHPRPAK